MLSLSDNNQADVVEALNSTSRCLDDYFILIIRTYSPGADFYTSLSF